MDKYGNDDHMDLAIDSRSLMQQFYRKTEQLQEDNFSDDEANSDNSDGRHFFYTTLYFYFMGEQCIIINLLPHLEAYRLS